MEKFIVLLPLLTCVLGAITPQGGTPRLVQSNKTEPGEVTYYASIYYDTKFGMNIICGATIISRFDVLTSASCLKELGDKLDISKITVVGGDYRRNYVDVGMEQLRPVQKVTFHELFKPETGENDLAIITIEGEFIFGFYLSKLKIPYFNPIHPRPIYSGAIVGFGSVTGSGMDAIVLRKLMMHGREAFFCADLLPDEYLTDDMICLGGNEYPDQVGYPCGIEDVGAGFKAQCSANNINTNFVCGIRIGTATCDSDEDKSIIRYTYIPKYHQWIRENMKGY